MTVVTFLTDQQQARVNSLLSDEKEIFRVQSWDELERTIRVKSVSVLILNPAADGNMDIDAAADLLRKYPMLPIVAYVALDPASFRGMIELSQRGLFRIVLQGFEDSPERFGAMLNKARANPFATQLLSRLRPNVTGLSVRLAHTVEELFQMPHRFGRAYDLAAGAGISLAHLYREFGAARLVSPRKLIVAAKLVQGVGYLWDSDLSVTEAARKLGYTRPRIFGQHSLEVLGVTPSHIRTHLSPEMADRRLRAWLAVPW